VDAFDLEMAIAMALRQAWEVPVGDCVIFIGVQTLLAFRSRRAFGSMAGEMRSPLDWYIDRSGPLSGYYVALVPDPIGAPRWWRAPGNMLRARAFLRDAASDRTSKGRS
jgi:hypothetical protein